MVVVAVVVAMAVVMVEMVVAVLAVLVLIGLAVLGKKLAAPPTQGAAVNENYVSVSWRPGPLAPPPTTQETRIDAAAAARGGDEFVVLTFTKVQLLQPATSVASGDSSLQGDGASVRFGVPRDHFPCPAARIDSGGDFIPPRQREGSPPVSVEVVFAAVLVFRDGPSRH